MSQQTPLPGSEPPVKPTITEIQANYHVYAAGMAAQDAATRGGVDPDTARSLLSMHGLTIRGEVMPPITAAYMLLLPFLNAAIEADPRMAAETCQLMAMAHALHSPSAAWQLLQEPAQAGAWKQAVFEFSAKFSPADLKKIGDWIADEMRRMKADVEDTEGKSPLPQTTAEAKPE